MLKCRKENNREGSTREIVVQTTTGEFYFPCRLIYRISDRGEVLRKLRSLNCIEKDPQAERWCIHCDQEALDSKWSDKYLEQRKQGAPVVIGVIRFSGRKRMDIYLRCFECVVPVLNLIDKYIPRSSGIETHLDMCYQLITTNDPKRVPTPEKVFSKEKDIHYEEGFKAVDVLEEKAWSSGQDYSKEIEIAFSRVLKKTFTMSPVELHKLERRRLEAFYVDGPEHYDRMMEVSVNLGLARHSAGGHLNPLEFFEKVLMKGV